MSVEDFIFQAVSKGWSVKVFPHAESNGIAVTIEKGELKYGLATSNEAGAIDRLFKAREKWASEHL